MRDVFISHVEEDQAVALEIAKGLRAAGYTTWCYEEDSLPGPAYLLQTGEAIDGCRAVVLIISPDSLSSNQVTVEVVRAHESGKPFFPILRGITHPEFQARQPLWRQALGAASSIALPPKGVDAILPRLVAGLKALQVEPGAPKREERPPRPEPPQRPATKLQRGRWLWAAGGVLALAVVAYLGVRLAGPPSHPGPTQARSATATPAQAATAPTAGPGVPAPTQAVAAPTGAAPAAAPLEALAVFKGRLEGAGDTKYHQVTVPGGQHLIAVLDAADNRYANELYIRFGSLPTPEQYDDMGDLPGADQAVEIAGAQAGTYNLMVRAREYSTDYVLTVYDERSFPSLTMGAPVKGNLASAGDVRFHQVTTQAGEHLAVLLDAADNRYRNELYIRFGALPSPEQYDAKGGLPGADQAVEIANTQAGAYYVMVRSREYGTDYSLTACNDGTFPSLTMGAPVKGNLASAGDVRFHQVTTRAGEHLAVLLDAADNRYRNELYIRFGALPTVDEFDARGGLPGADQSVEIANTQAGTYYVMVRSLEYGTDYTIVAHNAGTFPALTAGAPAAGNLASAGDVKFHQISTQAGQHLIVLLDAADNRYANELYIRFGSLPTTEQFDDKGDVRGADQAVEIASTQAGIYYIMVYSREYGTDYTLTAQ